MVKLKEKGYEYVSENPGWIKKNSIVLDENFSRIIAFYVINTPCTSLSYSGIAMKNYGWDEKKVWKDNKLKNQLFSIAHLEKDKTFFVAKQADKMKEQCEKAKLKKQFHSMLNEEKIVIYKNQMNEFMSILYHIRNSFAHGRFTTYTRDNETIFVLESVRKNRGEFQVRSRMILKQTTLLKWIDIIQKNEIGEVKK